MTERVRLLHHFVDYKRGQLGVDYGSNGYLTGTLTVDFPNGDVMEEGIAITMDDIIDDVIACQTDHTVPPTVVIKMDIENMECRAIAGTIENGLFSNKKAGLYIYTLCDL